MRRIAVVLVLLVLIAPAGWAQKKKPLEFDTNDPAKTVAWMDSIWGPVREAGKKNNQLARDAAQEYLNKLAAPINGKTLRWPMKVWFVSRTEIGLVQLHGSITIREFRTDKKPIDEHHFSMPDPRPAWVLEATKGDIVLVEARIARIDMFAGNCDGSQSMVIALDNIKMTYKGKPSPRKGKK